MTQFCIEEAAYLAADMLEAREQEEAENAQRRPGEITDPDLQIAMEQAKAGHRQAVGDVGMSRGAHT